MYRYLVFIILSLNFMSAYPINLFNPTKSDPLLVWDDNVTSSIPKNFRTSCDAIKSSSFFSIYGLATLSASGSGQFSASQLNAILPKMKSPIWIIDLRQESHGFTNHRPVSWYGYENRANENLSAYEIKNIEADLLSSLQDKNEVNIYTILKKNSGHIIDAHDETIHPEEVQSEEQLVNTLGLNYKRFYVQDRHPPSNEIVDEFINFVNQLPSNAWLHFHCRAGSGRTTTFLVMYDIIRNAHHVSIDEIIMRHAALGPKNLAKLPPQEPYWRYLAAKERIEFVYRFYDYYTQFDSNPTLSWSEWNNQRTD